MSLEFIQTNSLAFTIGVASVAFIAVLWLLMLKFAFREKSFEEVVEEQRKRSLQEEMMSKQEKVKKDKEKERKHKKWGKRKDKIDQPGDTKQSSDPPASGPESLNETGDEIEVIEPKEVIPKKKQSKQSSQKPNIQAPVISSHIVANSVPEQPKKAPLDVPKQVVESNKVVENKEKPITDVSKDKEKPKVDAKSSNETPKSNKVVEVEVPAPVQTAQQTAVTASKKKKKAEQPDKTDVRHVTANNLFAMIKEAALDDIESQTLIEVLLNKQKEAAGWKKQVNDKQTLAVKKQLQEKDILLEQEHKANQATTLKLKQELVQEKTKTTTMEKMFQEKIATYQLDIQNHVARIKQAQELLAAEKASAQEKISNAEKAAETHLAATTKKFEEEKAQLMKTIKKLESESKPSASTAELEAAKKSREDLHKVHTLLVDQHTQLIASHKTEVKNLNSQLAESKKLLQESQNQMAALQKEVSLLKKKCADVSEAKKSVDEKIKSTGDTEAETKHLQVLLDEAKRHGQELDVQLKAESTKVIELTKENKNLVAEMENLQAENERLSAELAASNERVAGDGQEMLQQNGELDVKKELQQKAIDDEKDRILQEKEQVLNQLYDDLNSCKVKITSLSEELEQQRSKNNELREKNWKAVEALGAAETAAEQKIKDADERMKEIQREAEEKLKQVSESSANSASQELSQRLTETERNLEKLKTELSDSIKKYELESGRSSGLAAELREVQLRRGELEIKVSDSQQAVQDLRSEVQKTQQNCRSCLQKLFPAVTLDSTLPQDEWLILFEQQALNVLNAAASRDEVEKLLAQLSEAENEASSLKDKISHYEVVLADTEIVLNKLQDSAKSNELKWEEKLKGKELELKNVMNELEAIRVEKENLSSVSVELGRIEELEGEVKSLQQRLDSAENEKLSFQQKYDEVNKNYINVKDQIENKGKVIEDLQKEVASIDHVKKELEDVKSKLEKEKKISKDFSAQMVRLNSLVKIGQDALSAEQETVKKLQNQLNQLQATQVTTANGTSSPPTVQVSESPAKSVKSDKPKKSKKSDASGKK